MAIKHTIRNAEGEKVQVTLTPSKAIRKHCIECMGFQARHVSGCTSKHCPLYPYRLGGNPSRQGIEGNPELAEKEGT